ncbi:helix-turn-helix domain-containing protein, partial [Enterococcus hirae]|nr:helix-turn-helix domain-containing protein [Enterococcus hirae]
MEKYIENNYIEETVYRKKEIFEYLIYRQNASIKQICDMLDISAPTLYKEIDQMNQLLNGLLKIKSGIVYLNLKNDEQTELFLKKLYEQSDFLSILSLYLFNKIDKKNWELPISRSKFYSIKSKIIDFLKVNDLELKNQRIIGSRLKINWIKSVFSIKYGFEPLHNNDFIYCETEKFIQSINNIESCYLTKTESKILLYHLNLILNNPNEVCLTKEEERILSLTISPPFLENRLKNLFNITNVQNKQVLLNYVKLCFFLLNTHAFSPKIKQNYKNKVSELLITYPEISELLEDIEK